MKARLCVFALLLCIERVQASEFEPVNLALKNALGTTKAFPKTVPSPNGKEQIKMFYSKDDAGKAKTFAFVQKEIYPPNCTHTWVVAADAKTAKISKIRVVEMSCPHAFPTKEANYLSQYMGKGPADVATLDKKIDTIAKATGSCNLTTTAVKRTIQMAAKLKGTL
ncbi:hypothetical protein K2X30_05305 [bacterium]|nr:hypothetical protein [bacterium]